MKSVKKIAELLEIDMKQATIVHGLITGIINPNIFDSVDQWCRQCYNEPRESGKIMVALNEVIEGYGVEYFGDNDGNGFEYINMGNTYTPTIIYHNGQYHFECWNDYIEKIER